MSFTGGKLKLKGSAPPGIGKKKKKKQRAQESNELALVEGEQSDGQKEDAGEHGKETAEGYRLKPEEVVDRRTEAERCFGERQAKLEAERVAKMASKSHRDRVNDFNQYLANLTEHHDIPRVGPG